MLSEGYSILSVIAAFSIPHLAKLGVLFVGSGRITHGFGFLQVAEV